MIESILIDNFRGIQTGQIDRFRKFNLLVGPNNSGKSAVLEAIYLTATANRRARLTEPLSRLSCDGRVSERDFLGDDPLARVLARHNYAELPPSLSGGQNMLNIAISSPSAPLPIFDINLEARPNKKKPYQIGLFSFKEEHSVASEEKDREREYLGLAQRLVKKDVEALRDGHVTYCWAVDLTYYQSGTAVWMIKDQGHLNRHALFYDVSSTLSHLPLDFYRRMIATVPGWTHKIAQCFGKIFGLDVDFNVTFLQPPQEQQWTQGWIAPVNQLALTIDSYGDGARSAFKALTPLLALAESAKEDAPGLFLWEEPEHFQNPQTLGRLLKEVAVLMKDKPMQLFIATQSLEVIAHFMALAQEGAIKPDELMAFRLNLKEGKLSSSHFTIDNLTAWAERGLDPRVWGDFHSPLQFGLRRRQEEEV